MQERSNFRMTCYEDSIHHCYFEHGRRALAKECRQPLESGKGKDVDFFLEPSKGTEPQRHIDFSSVTPILE